MRSVRWRKIAADLSAERGRVAIMVIAVAVSLLAVGAVLGARAILTREIVANYLGTRPAEATIELAQPVTDALLAEVRARPEVRNAASREVLLARVKVGEDWRPLLLFVAEDFDDLRLGVFRREHGAWPPPRGTVLVERSARSMIESDEGRTIVVKTPHGAPREVTISGVVHDPGLAPAWQEREGYAYATRETLAELGEAPELHELLVTFRAEPADIVAAETSARELGAWLEARGHHVHQLRVPPPRKHPHQRQMETILLMLVVFSGMALVLSAILVAATLAGILARQVREIGVMKAVGATTAQLARLYAAAVTLLGVAAFLVAWPLGVLGARALAGEVSRMLNFDLFDTSVGAEVPLVLLGAGVLVPLAFAAIPIFAATRRSVRAAIEHRGVVLEGGSWMGRLHLPRPVRDALRRPSRLALTLVLLAAGGAMFMTALAVSRAWERNLDKIHETRHYDVEVRFDEPVPNAVAERIARVAGVRRVELWGECPAAFARPGELDVVRTYPDRSHGSLVVLAPPPDVTSITFPLVAGRWLEAGDTDAVVLNHSALAQSGGRKVGDRVTLSLDGVPSSWTLVGVVEEIGSPGAAYVSRAAFTRVTNSEGRSRMLRIASAATTPSERTEVIRAIERALATERVETVVPFTELRTAVGDHVGILIRALVAMATIMAIVGLLGLTSTMGISVVERTREIGVMKAIGATRGRVLRLFVGEGLFIAGASWAIAALASLPLTAFVDTLLGQLGFLAPLPFVLAPEAIAAWAVLIGAAALGATLVPARRAAALTVQEALREP